MQRWALVSLASILVWLMAAPASQTAQAETMGKLTAVKVEMSASDKGVVYQSYADRYVVGPNGWLEWRVTVKERLAGYSPGALVDLDRTTGVGFYERKRAVIQRQEGEHTLVFRFEPGTVSPSGPLTLDRNLSLDGQFGTIRYYAAGNDGQMTIKSTIFIDMNGAGGMASAQFKREYPTLTITPSPEDLRRSGQAPNGLSIDRIIVDVNDPVLDAKDFEFKYRMRAGSYSHASEWTNLAESQNIAVPPDARKKGVDLVIEVRDAGGNWRPYTYFYPGPGDMIPTRVTINPFDIIGGNVGDNANRFLRQIASESRDPHMEAELLRRAKSEFKYLEEMYKLPRESYTWLAVFLYSTGQTNTTGYTGYADIDLTRSGYLWSDSPRLPEADLPVTPFSETYRSTETSPLNGRQYQGHWGVISSELTRSLGEGEYYLFVKTVDAVTGGFMWQQVYYDADRSLTDKNAVNFAQVKLIKDRTRPVIAFEEQPFTRGEYVIRAKATDNQALGAVQYMVSELDMCGRSPGACESIGDRWIDAPIGGDGRTAELAIDTAALLPGRTAGMTLYLYVRAVDARYKAGAHYDQPFGSANSALIATGQQRYYVQRGQGDVELKATYASRLDDQGRLAAAPSHEIRLYTHATGMLGAEGDVRYRIETAAGATVRDWSTVPSGQSLTLTGEDGAYVLRAQALDASGVAGSREHTLAYAIGPASGSHITSATYSTTELINRDVTLTLTSDTPVKLRNAAGIDPQAADTTHTLTLPASTDFDAPMLIEAETDGGAVEQWAVSVGQIDKSGFGHLLGGYVAYTPSHPTVGEVTAHLYVGKRVKPGSGDGISYRDGWLSYTFVANGEHVFEAEDLAGNALRAYMDEAGRKATVTWIDSSAPAVTIAYSTTAATREPVTATLQLPPELTIVNNGGRPDYTFAANGSFDFQVKDAGGVVREYRATVANIDREAPTIVLDGPLTYTLYQGLPFAFEEPGYTATDNRDGDVTASVQMSQAIDVYKGGYYEIVYTVTDSAGNVGQATRGVSVMNMNGINLLVNGIRVRGEILVPRGTLVFDIAGQESEELVFRYLPGRHAAGAFKSGGTPIAGRTLTLGEPGWYTFFVQDRERRTFVGQIHVQ